jgi:hypothetical protein
MNQESNSIPTISSQPEIAVPSGPPLSVVELALVNDVISGRAVPTYQPEELALVQRAWHYYIAANTNRFSPVVTTMENTMRLYFAGYNKIRELYRNIPN